MATVYRTHLERRAVVSHATLTFVQPQIDRRRCRVGEKHRFTVT